MRKRNNAEAGMTLLEILIVTVISLFIVLTLLTILSSSRNAWWLSQAQSDLYLNARKAMAEMNDNFIEASSGKTDVFTFIDPINGEYSQGLWLASSRGDSTVVGEDGSGSNYYMHLGADNVSSSRSLVVYCPYETAEGVKQLRCYVDYGQFPAYYSGANIFPLTFISASTTALNFLAADGLTTIIISRTDGRVLANYIATEDTNDNNALDAVENDGDITLPVDNADGALNYGVNFNKSVGSITTSLFLAKEIRQMSRQGKWISTTLRSTVKFRQP